MSEERAKPEQGKEKCTERGDEETAQGSHQFGFPDCCRPMIENMKQAFAEAQGGDSKPADSCAAMMAQMMKSFRDSSGTEPESTPPED